MNPNAKLKKTCIVSAIILIIALAVMAIVFVNTPSIASQLTKEQTSLIVGAYAAAVAVLIIIGTWKSKESFLDYFKSVCFMAAIFFLLEALIYLIIRHDMGYFMVLALLFNLIAMSINLYQHKKYGKTKGDVAKEQRKKEKQFKEMRKIKEHEKKMKQLKKLNK